VQLPEYNVEKARGLLREAGYPNGFPMVLLGHKGDVQKRTILEMFQAEVMKVGITAEIQDMIWTAVMSRAKDWSVSRAPGSTYHTVLFYKSGDIWNPWGYVYRMFHSNAQLSKPGGQWNFSHYSNERVDSLMDAAIETTDPERALKMWREVNDVLVQDMPALYIDKLTDVAVMRKSVKGYVFREHYVGREYHYYELSRAK
jgi:peptide/nickel transport system substrate-binding protein